MPEPERPWVGVLVGRVGVAVAANTEEAALSWGTLSKVPTPTSRKTRMKIRRDVSLGTIDSQCVLLTDMALLPRYLSRYSIFGFENSGLFLNFTTLFANPGGVL